MMMLGLKIKQMKIIKLAIQKEVLRLTVIGRLLPTLAVATMHGMSISTTATSTTTISPIAITFVVLEQDSNLTFVLLESQYRGRRLL